MQTFSKLSLVFVISCCIAACTSDNDKSTNVNASTFGQVKSLDLAVINIEGNLNKWGTIQRGTSILEILLEIKDDALNNPTPSRWSLNIRTLPDPNGLKDISELDVRLFTNYLSECCANVTDPVGRLESYDKSYTAVAGSIDFNTSSEGVFDLFFQEETPARSNNVSGQIVNIKGCWKIAGEGATSGCSL